MSYWVPNVAGTLDNYLRYTLNERREIRRQIKHITRALREGGSVTGHPRSDRKMGA